jgi:hypothetical protein
MKELIKQLDSFRSLSDKKHPLFSLDLQEENGEVICLISTNYKNESYGIKVICEDLPLRKICQAFVDEIIKREELLDENEKGDWNALSRV